MTAGAAIYLAHLNPITKAHESIISSLQQKEYHVYVFPVRFVKNAREINTKSFPFSYEIRKAMVESVFSETVSVNPDYSFHAPYLKYFPPLFSPNSWTLRNQIIRRIKEDKFVSYTGDKTEWLMLKAYGLNPLRASRLEISASYVRDLLYSQAAGRKTIDGWEEKVPQPAAEIIKSNWEVIEKFAGTEDSTVRVMGMKFPKEGYK